MYMAALAAADGFRDNIRGQATTGKRKFRGAIRLEGGSTLRK